MALTILTWHLDLVLFVVASLLAATLVQLWVRKAVRGSRLGLRAWALILLITAVGASVAEVAGDRESQRIEEMVRGLAPTYAGELARLGLSRIRPDTPANDPVYLTLIDAQLRWQKANPFVADIYTFGRGVDGGICLLVDAETDYDRNGRIEGTREQRTTIGEPYDKDRDLLERAFAGEAVFTPNPTTDRWGTWVSTYVPAYDDNGKVIGVLGVDYPASRWIHSVLYHRGSVYGMAGVVQAVAIGTAGITAAMRAEISKRRRTEAALRASEGKLRTILDHEPECVMVMSPDGRLQELNPAGTRLLGGGASLLGAPLRQFVRPEHQSRFDAHVNALLSQTNGEAARPEQVVEFEFVARSMNDASDTRLVWVETHSVPLRDENGNMTGILSVARDVSARKRAEADREALNRQLLDASRRAGMAEVATGVLHNVGNVLNSVNISAEAIGDHLRSADVSGLAKAVEMIDAHRSDLAQFLANDDIGRQIPDYLTLLSQCLTDEHRAVAGELSSLRKGIDHIKQIVRVQQSFARGSTVVAPVSPADIAREAVRLNSVALERGHITVDTELADLPDLPLDRHKVLQVLVNLISNAEQAVRDAAPFRQNTPDAPRRVTVRVREGSQPGWVAFEVQDSGVGIAPENLEKIFRRGFTTKVDGHGFGLHASANAASEMGGRLTAASDGIGRGARFILELPTSGQGTGQPQGASGAGESASSVETSNAATRREVHV